ncbi:MAG: glycosyltransferase family 4 protein [Fibromonadales bacterium]|nr:glycosyltransferase family 4 protein [Fibromonadales bacterium]
MKILVDAHVFDNGLQGTTSYIKNLYHTLADFPNIQITLCASDINNLKNIFTDEKFEFIALKSKSKIWRLFYEYPKIIQNGKFDFAHFQYIVPFRKKCLYINTIHDILFLDFPNYFDLFYRITKGFLFKLSAKKSDIIFTVSQFSKNRIAEIFSIPKDNIHISPNAVQVSKMPNIDVKEKYGIRNFIHYVARFEPRKNQIGLLKAYLNSGLHNNYDLVFIGRIKDKIETKYYEKFVKLIPSDVKINVHIFENLSEEELVAFYKQSSCFAYPSFAEGFGIPPIEAGLNCCKVLCSNQTAMADFDFFKYTFNPNNENELQQKILEVLKDDEYPFEEIKKTIIEKYSLYDIANNFYNIVMRHQ